MTTPDLITRLRGWPNLPGLNIDKDLMNEAVDELERQAAELHAQNTEMARRQAAESATFLEVSDMAAKALKREHDRLGELERLRADLDEQCRLIGMGSEREARLIGERDQLRRDVDRLRALDLANQGVIGEYHSERDAKLDAEQQAATSLTVGDVPAVVRTAPTRIWLQVSDDASHMHCDFPRSTHGDEVTWSPTRALDCEVEYVRADLAAAQPAAQAEPVADECILCGPSDKRVWQMIERAQRANGLTESVALNAAMKQAVDAAIAAVSLGPDQPVRQAEFKRADGLRAIADLMQQADGGWNLPASATKRIAELLDEMLSADPSKPAAQGVGEYPKRVIFDAIRSAYDLGYNDARNARTVPGDSPPSAPPTQAPAQRVPRVMAERAHPAASRLPGRP